MPQRLPTSDPDQGFPPIADLQSQILILGSMPGQQSLQAQQYYAHPRNAFWKIMARLLEFTEDASYQQRIDLLKQNRIALWDVIAECVRPGSLDANIVSHSIQVNPLVDFISCQSDLRRVCFNGAKAEQLFNRHIWPELQQRQIDIERIRLPSTSPAHASLTFEQKCQCWAQALFD